MDPVFFAPPPYKMQLPVIVMQLPWRMTKDSFSVEMQKTFFFPI